MSFHSAIVLTLAVVASVAFPGTLSAQALVGWGVKVGLTRANQTLKDYEFTTTFQSRVGLSIGGFAEWVSHPILSVSTEVCYNQKGHRLDMPITTTEFPDGTGEFIRESVRFDYLSLAILPKVRLPVGPVHLYVLFGPRVDIALNHSVNVEGREPIRTYFSTGWESQLKHYKDVQVGGDLAVGCVGDVGLPMNVGAEVRYSPDFTSSSELSYWSTRNSAWEFCLLLAF
jgi:hypothetical protein